MSSASSVAPITKAIALLLTPNEHEICCGRQSHCLTRVPPHRHAANTNTRTSPAVTDVAAKLKQITAFNSALPMCCCVLVVWRLLKTHYNDTATASMTAESTVDSKKARDVSFGSSSGPDRRRFSQSSTQAYSLTRGAGGWVKFALAPSNAEVTKEWSYTSTSIPNYVFMSFC